MEAMSASISRLCQMVHDAGLRPGTEEHLQVVLLEATRARGRLDDIFISLFDEVLVGFLDKFTVVKKLQAEAERKFRAEAEKLEKSLEGTNKKLNELLQGKRGTDRQLVSKELESAILEARREKAKTQKQLKNVRKELNADIESLGFTLKVINIVLVPVLVILFGILRAVVRRRR